MKDRRTDVRALTRSIFVLASSVILAAVVCSCSGSGVRVTSYGLEAKDVVISHEKDAAPGQSRVFHPGDKIYIRFSLSGYKLDSLGNLWIQEDLSMNDPKGEAVLTRPNLIDDRVPPPEGAESVPVNNTITLFDTAQPGTHTIMINVRDKIGGGAVYIEAQVKVEPR